MANSLYSLPSVSLIRLMNNEVPTSIRDYFLVTLVIRATLQETCSASLIIYFLYSGPGGGSEKTVALNVNVLHWPGIQNTIPSQQPAVPGPRCQV